MIFLFVKSNIWNVNCTRATTLLMNRCHRENAEVLETENASSKKGLESIMLESMPNALPCVLPGADVCCRMFWNTGSGGMPLAFLRIKLNDLCRCQSTTWHQTVYSIISNTFNRYKIIHVFNKRIYIPASIRTVSNALISTWSRSC